MKLKFARDVSDLSKTVTSFNRLSNASKRKVVGNHPVYFVHTKRGDKHQFCVSKACYVRDFQFMDYIKYRNYFGGGGAQHKISYLTDSEWRSYFSMPKQVQESFKEWLNEFFPTKKIRKAQFISLDEAIAGEREVKKRELSAKDLRKQIKNQSRIGEIGEEIAFQYELGRVRKTKDVDPKEYVVLLSKKNVNAGYDIKSYDQKKKRPKFIEVKATTRKNNYSFHLSRNEKEFLAAKGPQAYIYLVYVSDVEKRTGKVFKVISNPIPKLSLSSESYLAKLK